MVLRLVRRVVVTIAGVVVLAIGVALIVLPGPGFLVIAAGFSILATEYAWARRWLVRMRDRAVAAMEQATRHPAGTALTIATAVGMMAIGVALIAVESLPLASPWTGGSLVGGGLILLATTVYAVRGTGFRRLEAEAAADERSVR